MTAFTFHRVSSQIFCHYLNKKTEKIDVGNLHMELRRGNYVYPFKNLTILYWANIFLFFHSTYQKCSENISNFCIPNFILSHLRGPNSYPFQFLSPPWNALRRLHCCWPHGMATQVTIMYEGILKYHHHLPTLI